MTERDPRTDPKPGEVGLTNKIMTLPDIEIVSAKVHEDWMEKKLAVGVSSRVSLDGEELMVPYAQLSENAKQLDRDTVKTVYAAIQFFNP